MNKFYDRCGNYQKALVRKADGLQTKTSYGFRNNDAANSGLNQFHLSPIMQINFNLLFVRLPPLQLCNELRDSTE